MPREGVQSASAVLRGNPHHQSSQSLQSSPGFEPGASGVRRPCANPLGNLAMVARPRARPLGNLTTVGHLAKASLDLGLHFQTHKKTSFDIVFNDGTASFRRENGWK